MKYGLTFVPDYGRFKGFRCAVMRTYAFPWLFEDYAEAERHAEQFFGFMVGDRGNAETWRERLLVKIEAESKCLPLIARVVEYYSGRLEIVLNEQGTPTFQIKNPTKKTYAELRDWFLADQESRRLTELNFIKHAEKTKQEHETDERKKTGVRLAVPVKKDRSGS